MRLFHVLRSLVPALLCLGLAGVLLSSLLHGLADRRLLRTLERLPDQDCMPKILNFQQHGRIAEALDWARYVTNNPALPNQIAATQLVTLLEREQTSVWHQADRAAKGFLTGSGASVEEMGGAIASDMVVYGDCRDLVVQGYYRLTGHESDAIVAALASVGLLTELVDAIDWAPAVLKAFRKANAMSRRFGEWLVGACRRSTKARKLDPALKCLFEDLKRLHNRLGLAKTAAVFRQVDTAEDVALLAKFADSHPEEVYRFLETAGDGGIRLLRKADDIPCGTWLMPLATRKGQAGIDALRAGGNLRSLTLSVRYGERVIRSLRLQRPQQFLHALAMRSPAARQAMWGGTLILAGAGFCLIRSVFRRPANRPYAVCP